MFAIFGPIQNPLKNTFGSYEGIEGEGLILFMSNLTRLLVVGAGIFAFINLLISGIQFIGSMGIPEQTAAAWRRIYMSLIGLAVIVTSYAVAVILGILFFNDPSAIISPKVYGPGTP
ncbi:hypothetical protein A2783_05770 [Microgenomates group bacterium RIFCSPHIGHO2_01_FULL_45_11]|nr:MAG: hypothetical protein A2783_05770 [Microgenomates group bacterium RIFCSPHIGHO2_01_FULL_45_11]